jgi:hypothetical protein
MSKIMASDLLKGNIIIIGRLHYTVLGSEKIGPEIRIHIAHGNGRFYLHALPYDEITVVDSKFAIFACRPNSEEVVCLCKTDKMSEAGRVWLSAIEDNKRTKTYSEIWFPLNRMQQCTLTVL